MNVSVSWMMFQRKKLKYRIASSGPPTKIAQPISCGATKSSPRAASRWRSDRRGRAKVVELFSSRTSLTVGPSLSFQRKSLLLQEWTHIRTHLVQAALNLRRLIPDPGVEVLVNLLLHCSVVRVAVLQLEVLRVERLDHRARELFAIQDLVR